MTLQTLLARHGNQWIIADLAGGGWYAVRRVNLGTQQRAQGLSNVRCGQDLNELAGHLDEEARLEKQPRARPPLWQVS